jgi:type I restriction enzyme, S subunit
MLNKNTTLGKHITTLKGFAFKSKWYSEEGRSIVKVSNFTDNSIDASGLVCLPENIANQYLKYQLIDGDIIIQTVGSWPSNPQSVVGKVIKTPKPCNGALLNQNAVKIIPDDDIGKKYLFYLLKSQSFKDYIIGTAQGAASQASITLDSIKNFSFDLVDLNIQQKISSILSAYDDLIENNTRRIAILEEMAQMIFREWFVKFRFPGHEKVKMVDSPLGEIPEGWERKPVGELLEMHIGGGWGKENVDGTHDCPAYVIRGTDIPTARSLNVMKCPLRYHSTSNLSSRTLGVNDIVMEVSGGSNNQPVGRAILITEQLLNQFDGELICASFCKKISVNESILNSKILFHHVSEIYGNGKIEQYQVQSTGIKNFKFAVFLEKENVIVPPIKIQKEYSKISGLIMRCHQNLGAKNVKLIGTRDLLLPKLISGKLDVSDLDIEIPEINEHELHASAGGMK